MKSFKEHLAESRGRTLNKAGKAAIVGLAGYGGYTAYNQIRRGMQRLNMELDPEELPKNKGDKLITEKEGEHLINKAMEVVEQLEKLKESDSCVCEGDCGCSSVQEIEEALDKAKAAVNKKLGED